MKRVLCMILALLMILSITACGTTTDDPSEVTGADNTQVVTEADTDFFPDIEKKDYQGETFRMIGWSSPEAWYYSESYNSDAEDGASVLGNALYERNTMIEDYLGVKMEYEFCEGHVIYDTVQTTVMSGDDVYQACFLHPYYGVSGFVTQNFAFDLYELPAFNIDQPYWNRDVIEQLAINDQAFIGLGDVCRYDLNILYCNKNLLEAANMTAPYDLVRNGTWVLDAFFSMTQNLYVDNGDGQKNNMDTYGFAALWDANGSVFMQACDIYVATRNDDGDLELSLYGNRLIDMYDRLYSWTKDESTYIWNFSDRSNENVMMEFLDGKIYFTHSKLGTQYLMSEFAVGVLPMPKYDAYQESYSHVNWGDNLMIPSSIKNDEMVGEVLELMGYYAKTILQPKYYDEVLQLRVSDAPDDRDMVELIYNTVVFDPGIAFCDGNNGLYNLVYLPCFAIREDKANISSFYKTNSRTAERFLSQLADKVG